MDVGGGGNNFTEKRDLDIDGIIFCLDCGGEFMNPHVIKLNVYTESRQLPSFYITLSQCKP